MTGTRIIPHVHLELDCHCPTEQVLSYDELRTENERLTLRAKHYEANWKNAEHVITLRDAEAERLRAAPPVVEIAPTPTAETPPVVEAPPEEQPPAMDVPPTDTPAPPEEEAPPDETPIPAPAQIP